MGTEFTRIAEQVDSTEILYKTLDQSDINNPYIVSEKNLHAAEYAAEVNNLFHSWFKRDIFPYSELVTQQQPWLMYRNFWVPSSTFSLANLNRQALLKP
jgi:hypothetical protein